MGDGGRWRPGWRVLPLGLAASGVMAWTTLVPASGQAAGVTYSFSPTSGPAGTEVTFSGSGCPNEPDVTRTGRFDIFSAVDGSTTGPVLGFATFRSDANGNFSGKTAALVEGPLGPHRTLVNCTGGTTSRGDFTLTAAATPASTVPSTSTTVAASTGSAGTSGTTPTTVGASPSPALATIARELALTG